MPATHPTLNECQLECDRLRAEQAELVLALQPILDVVEIHDSDTLSHSLPDETVLWAVETVMSPLVVITLGNLRQVRMTVLSHGRPELRRSLLPFYLDGFQTVDEATRAFGLALGRRFPQSRFTMVSQPPRKGDT